MKVVMIEYTLRDASVVDEVERGIAEFVAGIRDLAIEGVRYTSHRRGDLSYVHIGVFPDQAAADALPAAAFFKPFVGMLRERCKEPPRTTWLDVVATTG